MVSAQAVKFVVMGASTVVLARLLTPRDYGLVGMVVVVTGFVSLFKNLGLSTVMIQRPELTHEQVSTLFWLNLVISGALALITLLLSPFVAWFYSEPRLTAITALFGVGFIISGLSSSHEAIIRRQMRFFVLAAIDICALLLGIVVAIVMASRGAGVWALVFNQLTFLTVYTVGLWIVCSWLPGLPVRNSGVRPLLAFGRDLTGYNVLNYFTRNLDNLLIGKFWGAQQLGIYAKAYQLLLMPLEQMGIPLDGIALTALSRLTDSPDRYRRVYLRMLDKVAMFSMPGVALMIVTSDWLVRILLGPTWTEAVRIFAVLGLMGLFEPTANTMGWLMISQGRSKHVFQWGIINSTLAVSSFIIGLKWGAFGIALSFSLMGVFVRVPLLFWFATRVGPIQTTDIYRRIILPLVAAAIVFLTIYVIRDSVVVSPFMGMIIASALAFAVTLAVFLITSEGRARIQDVQMMIRQILHREAHDQMV